MGAGGHAVSHGLSLCAPYDESIISFLASVGGALLRTTAEALDSWSLAALLSGRS
jgi:hypothetical protein